MRHMSFTLTERQFLDGSKTVTRRLGWEFLRPGDRVLGVRKAMGLKKGEKQVVLGEIEVVRVTRERLTSIRRAEVVREGFPEMTPTEFREMFRRHMGCAADDLVTRIEFKHVVGVPRRLLRPVKRYKRRSHE